MAAAKAKAKAKAAAKKPKGAAADLLAQILAAPDDIELRLVYADALIEAGDPRGTFIAHQCALSKLDLLDERYPELLASTARLEAAHGDTWCGGSRAALRAVFEDGFLHRVALTPDRIAKEWPTLRRHEPIYGMELLVGEDLSSSYRALAEPKDLTSLKVTPDRWFTASSVGNVLAWGMPRLRDLDLSRCDLGPTGASLLANEPTDLAEHFEGYVDPPPFAEGQLERLILTTCNVHDAGARILFAAKSLAALVELDLAQNRLADNATLEAMRAMKSLRRLALSGNNTLSLGTLAGWDVLAKLEQLAVPQSITSDALGALFPKPSPALRELDLRSAKALAATPGTIASAAVSFTSLDLGGTSLGDAGWQVLVTAPSLRSVMHLMANGCSLSDTAVTALVKSKLGRLVTLDLSSNKLTDASLEALAGWSGLAHVVHLRIGNNKKLTAAGYQALIDAPPFQPAVLDVGKSPKPIVDRLRERYGDVVLAKA